MIAEIIAGATSLTSLGTIIWLVHGRVKDREALAAARIAQIETEGHTSDAVDALQALQTENDELKRKNRILSEALNAEINRAAPLAPDDVAGRMRRLEVIFSTEADGGVSAGDGGGAVSFDPAPDAAEAGELPAEPATELR